MATETRSTLDKLFLDQVEPELVKAFNEECLAFDLFTKTPKHWQGRKHIFDWQTTRGGGVGARPEGGATGSALPTPVGPDHINGEVYYKRLYGTGELSYDAISTSRGKGAAFQEAFVNVSESLLGRLKKYSNACFFGHGSGILATVASIGSSGKLAEADGSVTTDLVVDTTRYLEEGDIVAVWTDASATATAVANAGQTYYNGTYDSEAVYISAIATETGMTLKRSRLAAGDSTIAAGDTIRFFGDRVYAASASFADNQVPMGLRGIADDSVLVDNFQGQSRTTYTKIKGTLLAAGSMTEGTTLHQNHFIKLNHACHRKDGSAVPDMFICDPALARQYLNITFGDHRWAGVDDYDAGFGREALKITVGDKLCRLFIDYDCPYTTLFAVPRKELEWYEHTPLHFDSSMGGVLKQAKPYGSAAGTGDVFYFYARMFGNWATKKPWAFGAVTGLSAPLETA